MLAHSFDFSGVVELGFAAEMRTGPVPAAVAPGGAVNSLRRLPLGKVKLPINLARAS